MDSSLCSLDSPPLSAFADGVSPPPPLNWKNIVVSADPAANDQPLSFYPSELEIIPFSSENLSKGAQDWNLCLVGYSVERRPFYKALLGAIRKYWNLKDFVHQEAMLKMERETL